MTSKSVKKRHLTYKLRKQAFSGCFREFYKKNNLITTKTNYKNFKSAYEFLINDYQKKIHGILKTKTIDL